MQQIKDGKTHFTNQLLKWHRSFNTRDLPWKNEKDPYKIWLSEILLQQTRSAQAIPYYNKFIENFPTIRDLGLANEDSVFRLWAGLGYYNRCRNLLATAQFVTNELDGKFPGDHDSILSLKGVGPYTAAAIASFAYGLPYAVVDGNVFRVLSRYFGIETPIDSTAGKKEFTNLAMKLLPHDNSAEYNQAVMDFGAIVCTPSLPDCKACLMRSGCVAAKNDLISLLPVKIKKLNIAKRNFNYFLVHNNDHIYLRKRTGKDIWQSLYEPLLFETENAIQLSDSNLQKMLKHVGIETFDTKLIYSDNQRLTHQLIAFRFYVIYVGESRPKLPADFMPISFSEIDAIPMPKTIHFVIKKYLYL